jgi:hypothetical protein
MAEAFHRAKSGIQAAAPERVVDDVEACPWRIAILSQSATEL